MTKKPVLVVGSLNMDLVVSARSLPKKGQTVFGKQFSKFSGGKGANQAVAASKLGAPVTMVGCVGCDGFAAELLAGLQANGIDTAFIRQVDDPTGTALITVDEEGANTIVVVAGANLACSPADVERALAKFKEPGVLLVQHEIPEDTVEYTIRQAKELGWMVILNPAPVRPLDAEILPLVDVIIPNEGEMALLANKTVDTPDEALIAAGRLLAWGVGAVIVTLGEKGAVCHSDEGIECVPAYEVKSVDTTGSGDAYAGALAVALAEGFSMAESMHFAAAAAALSVTRYGAQPSLPCRQEVDEFIKTNVFPK